MATTYALQVYAGILGKVIGVYMGRPVEGWTPQRIQETYGLIDRYVADEAGCPLVVPDDDISGTLTFIRALEDSGKLENTPEDFFGKTWLNYLLEGQTVLWWGGMGVSTEHTAYLRLKAGVPSPQSGSSELNGKVVSEQIGAQIFIDCFGLVAPSNPQLAVELAGHAARVSHDGEAVYAAQVVAAMVAGAFSTKDMNKLLNAAVSFIPKQSLIAHVHHDVRAWCKKDKDWRQTLKRIEERYGYDSYGGGCHVIPNHAIMVMAWSYAPDNFHLAQTIVNSAGYDTDCNAANVGSVMGVLLGLDGICQDYDFRTPMADRIILPTADGTNSATDCWNEARRIARLGEQIQRLGTPQEPHVWMDFAAPGAVHGFMADAADNRTILENPQGTGLLIRTSKLKSKPVQLFTPLYPLATTGNTSYRTIGTSKLYSGMMVSADIQAEDGIDTCLLLVIQTAEGSETVAGPSLAGSGRAMVTVPDTKGYPVLSLGLKITADTDAKRQLKLVAVNAEGSFRISTDSPLRLTPESTGWITHADAGCGHLVSNGDPAFTVTGNRWWRDTTFRATLSIHLAEQAGILCAYQGTQRYISLTRRQNKLILALQHYGETILDSSEIDWTYDEPRVLTLQTAGDSVMAYVDGTPILRAQNLPFANGACGFICQAGRMDMASVQINGTSIPLP